MFLLIAYDVATSKPEGERRWRRVARACQDFGQRVQKSVFECQVGPMEWAQLRERLLKEAIVAEDSLRVYIWMRECASSIWERANRSICKARLSFEFGTSRTWSAEGNPWGFASVAPTNSGWS